LLLSSLFPYAVRLFDIEKLINRVYVKNGDEANPERELLPFDHGVKGGGGGVDHHSQANTSTFQEKCKNLK
jgi:hypothetical protein